MRKYSQKSQNRAKFLAKFFFSQFRSFYIIARPNPTHHQPTTNPPPMNQTNQNQQEAMESTTTNHDQHLHSDQLNANNHPQGTEYDAVINESMNHIFQSLQHGLQVNIDNLAAEYSSLIKTYHGQSTMYQERTVEVSQQMLQLMKSIKPPNFEDVTTPVKPNQQSQAYDNEDHIAQEE
jgi:hypothetical protein